MRAVGTWVLCIVAMGCPSPHSRSSDSGTDADADAADVICASPCELVNSCGCGARQKCSLMDACNTIGCVPAGIYTQDGDCSRNNDSDCAPGYRCVLDPVPHCAKYCDTNADCESGDLCNRTLAPDSSCTSGATYRVCSHPCLCNLLDQTGCSTSLCSGACYLANAPGTGDCLATATNGTSGQPCTYLNDCAPGFTCWRTPSGQVCHRLCDASGASPTCMAGEGRCSATGGTTPDGRPIGLCM